MGLASPVGEGLKSFDAPEESEAFLEIRIVFGH
jgi:hypothetical protein